MPRRTGLNQSKTTSGGGSFFRNSPGPSQSQPQPQPQPQAQKQPGLLKQTAAIAAGVGAGTAVGHAVGSALTGGNRWYRDREYAPEYYEQQQQQSREQGRQDPCDKEITAFLKCTQEQKDISICEGFVEAIRQCRKYGASALSEAISFAHTN